MTYSDHASADKVQKALSERGAFTKIGKGADDLGLWVFSIVLTEFETQLIIMNIYVGNLSYRLTGQELKEIFEQYGTVAKASVIEDRETGRSKGFGFVEMESAEAGQLAIQKLNETELDGRKLNVNEARPREERPRDDRPRNNDRNDRGGDRRDSRGGGRNNRW